MLKRVPNDLSPYSYPRQPGFATGALINRDQMQVIQPTLYLDGSFVLKVWCYDAYPMSDMTVQSEAEFQLGSDAQTAWAKQLEELELQGFDILVESEAPLICPVAADYVFDDITVIAAVWDPWQKQFTMQLTSPNGEAAFEKGMAIGNIDVAGRFMDHLQDTFGYAPKVQL